jgi:ribosomal 50S subunit-recycling heat shock protein
VRLDLFLKSSRLVPRRSIAKHLCELGAITINGLPVKASKEIKVGDQIELKRGERRTIVRVMALPIAKQVSKSAASTLFEVLSDQHHADPLLS